MILTKVIVGFVAQRFDTETQTFVGQEFIAGDDVCWENSYGEKETPPQVNGKEPYLNMEMFQPPKGLINGL